MASYINAPLGNLIHTSIGLPAGREAKTEVEAEAADGIFEIVWTKLTMAQWQRYY